MHCVFILKYAIKSLFRGIQYESRESVLKLLVMYKCVLKIITRLGHMEKFWIFKWWVFFSYEIELTLWKQRQKLIVFLVKLLWTCNCPTNECESVYSLVAMNYVEYFKDHIGDNYSNSCWLSWWKPVGLDKDVFRNCAIDPCD